MKRLSVLAVMPCGPVEAGEHFVAICCWLSSESTTQKQGSLGLLLCLLGHYLTLKKDATFTSETALNFYQAARRHNRSCLRIMSNERFLFEAALYR
jgi:hypothetical protein